MPGPAFTGRQLSMNLSMAPIGEIGSARNRSDGRADPLAGKTREAGALLRGQWKVSYARLHVIE